MEKSFSDVIVRNGNCIRIFRVFKTTKKTTQNQKCLSISSTTCSINTATKYTNLHRTCDAFLIYILLLLWPMLLVFFAKFPFCLDVRRWFNVLKWKFNFEQRIENNVMSFIYLFFISCCGPKSKIEIAHFNENVFPKRKMNEIKMRFSSTFRLFQRMKENPEMQELW